jgi:hypothetical protein
MGLGGPARAGEGGDGRERTGRGGWGARVGKDRAGGSSTGALCTGFTLVLDNKVEQFFSSKIYPNKVTSLKVHLTQIHFHIAPVLPLRQH